MKTSDFFAKLCSRYLWGNIAGMVLVVVALVFGAKMGIDVYTRHGEAIPIPKVVKMQMTDAKRQLEALGLKVVVTDTGYVKNLPAGCVLEQNPEPGERVKTGHAVYLIINSAASPTITIPDVIDNSSLREAMAKLSAMGFRLETPKFVAGEKDWVYGIMANGREVVAGDKVPVDVPLVIMVGNGMRSATDSVDYIDPGVHEEDTPLEWGGEEDEFEETPIPEPSHDKPTL